MGVVSALTTLVVAATVVTTIHGADYRMFLKKAQSRATPSQVWRRSQDDSKPPTKAVEMGIDFGGRITLKQAEESLAAADDDASLAAAYVQLAVVLIDDHRDVVGGIKLLDKAVDLQPHEIKMHQVRDVATSKLIDYAVVHPYFGFNRTVVEEAVTRTSHPNFQFTDAHRKVPVGPNKEDVHLVVQMWQLHQRAIDYDEQHKGSDNERLTRQLMLNMLRGGLKADVLFNWGFHRNAHSIGGTPLGFLANSRVDIELFEAFVEAGHLLDPSINYQAEVELDKMAAVPREYYRRVHHRSSHGISIVHLLANGAASVMYMRDIYKAYNNYVKHKTPFYDALAEQKLDRFWRYSPTLVDIFEKVAAGAPLFDINLTKAVLSASDTELEVAMLKMMFKQPTFRIEDHLTLTMPDNFSPLLMAAGMNRTMTLRVIREHCAEQIALFPQRADAIRSAIRTATEARTAYEQRSALHIASLFFGQEDKIFQEIIKLQELAAGSLDYAKTKLVDAFGKTPFDYDAKVTVETRFNEEAAAFLAKTPNEGFPQEYYQYTEADSGGWGIVEDPPPNDCTIPPDFCEVTEYDGLPSPEVFGAILERNEPVVFRNAVKDWLIRDVWTYENFRKKFDNRSISVSAIPYQERFDETSADVSLKMTVAEYLQTWGDDAELFETTQAPRYLFSASMPLDYPDIMDDITDLTELLDHFDYKTSQMGKQFYFGPRYTGAPMHYHNTAINALAYGKKRWFITLPNQTFYSIKAPKQLLKDDINNLVKNATLKQCVQFAGDLMFVGTGWGHATLNEQASIGFAMEWMDQRLTAAISIPPFYESIDFKQSQYTHDRRGPYGDIDDLMSGNRGEPLPPNEAGDVQRGEACVLLSDCAAGLVCADHNDNHILTKSQKCQGTCQCDDYNPEHTQGGVLLR